VSAQGRHMGLPLQRDIGGLRRLPSGRRRASLPVRNMTDRHGETVAKLLIMSES